MNDTDAGTLAAKLRGKFIVLDGPDGAGKTTQLKRLAAVLGDAGLDVVTCRDPGGTAIGDRIRSVLLDHDLGLMDPTCEATLFMASRAQLLGEIIRPALRSGRTVLCDRFVSSTCAYQGATGMDPSRVIELARWVIGDTWPAMTVILDVSVADGFSRVHTRGSGQVDAMERRSLDYHRRVRDLFLALPEVYPAPVTVVSGHGDVDTVHQRLLECLGRVTL